MYDVALYGHITFDQIISKNSKDFTVGSIGNVWRNLVRAEPSLLINVEATDFGDALILVDEERGVRSSTANLSIHTREPKIQPASWHHILYVNEISNASFIGEIDSGIISVDFCRGRVLKNIEILKKVDFVFISDEDIFMDLLQMSELVKKGVIMHHSGGSEYYENGKLLISSRAEIVENVNVLGCGDMFAASFIKCFLKSRIVKKSIEDSHTYVTEYLVKNRGDSLEKLK